MVQVTGGSSRRAMPGRGLWAAGAFGVRALTQAAALELREQEIHVALLVVDAGIDRSGQGDARSADQPSLADAVVYLAGQSPRAMTHELQVTPALDNWTPYRDRAALTDASRRHAFNDRAELATLAAPCRLVGTRGARRGRVRASGQLPSRQSSR